MSLTLYNTLTRKKEPFSPIDAANVRMYVCGPTVYDFAHIGNARPVIVFDVLFRLLRHLYGESQVTYVRNITDVDDKINARAVRDYPSLDLNQAIRKVTESTTKQFHADVAALGCLPPTDEPKATDNIKQMVEIIQRLLNTDHAYIASGSEGREVLFSVSSMPTYGMLSGRKLDEQQAGARVAVEAHKKDPADFVLWKESGQREPGWNHDFVPRPKEGYPAEYKVSEKNRRELGLNSPQVTIHGRPGWHIECSAMSHRYLGEVFDIHGGGIDLVFPHHENEIAQSCCAFGHDVMANVWMHNGFLQVEGQKMSKSLGNFVTINELLATEKFGGRSWPGEVLRLAMLKTHYRQPIDFTVKALEEAEKTLDRWYTKIQNLPIENALPDEIVLSALFDDLNTPQAIAALHGLFDYSSDDEEITDYDEDYAIATASARILGILQHTPSGWLEAKIRSAGIDLSLVEPLINARIEARRTKNFAESDRIRDELVAMGIQLKDSKDADGNPATEWEVKR